MISLPPSSFIHQLGGIGGVEWLFIIIIIVVLFFGVRKIPEIAKSFGRATAEYEKARIQAKHELEQVQHENKTYYNGAAAAEDRKKLESVSKALGIDSTNKSDEELRVAIESEINKEKQKA